jgi:hypothetical protein
VKRSLRAFSSGGLVSGADRYGNRPLMREEARQLILQCVVRTHLDAVLEPCFKFLAHISQFEEHSSIQNFVPQLAVE